MKIDRVKISQEINFNGMPTWIGMEAELTSEDNEIDAIRKMQKSITDYIEEESKLTKPKWAKKEPPNEIQVTLEGIDKCLSMDELKEFWLISKGNLILSQAYKLKEKELTDAK